MANHPAPSVLPQKQYVSKRWLASRWMTSERTIDRLIAQGVLKAYRVGKLVRLDSAEAEKTFTSHAIVECESNGRS